MYEQKAIFKDTKLQRKRMTVDELIELWTKEYQVRLKKSTQSTYNRVAEAHIRPALGRLKVCDLTPSVVSEFIESKTEETGLSSSSVCSIVTVLNSMLDYARELGLDVKVNGKLARPKVAPSRTEVLTKREQVNLVEFLKGDPTFDNLGVLICVYTGIRIGEICALKWGDISLDKGFVSVKRTIQRIRNCDYDGSGGKTMVVFGVPKSRSANRTIPLPEFLIKLLRVRKCGDECFFLTGNRDYYLEPRTYQYRFKVILKKAGIEEKNFHALRHTFATNCIELGFDPKMLSQILGHSDVSITLNTYVHPSAERVRNFMELLGTSYG